MKDEQLYSIALTRIPGLGLIGIHKLVDALGKCHCRIPQPERPLRAGSRYFSQTDKSFGLS